MLRTANSNLYPDIQPLLGFSDPYELVPNFVPLVGGEGFYAGDGDSLYAHRIFRSIDISRVNPAYFPKCSFMYHGGKENGRLRLSMLDYMRFCGYGNGRQSGYRIAYFQEYLQRYWKYGWTIEKAVDEIIIPMEKIAFNFEASYGVFDLMCKREAFECYGLEMIGRQSLKGMNVEFESGGKTSFTEIELQTVCLGYNDAVEEVHHLVVHDLSDRQYALLQFYLGRDVFLGIDRDGGMETLVVASLDDISTSLENIEPVNLRMERDGCQKY